MISLTGMRIIFFGMGGAFSQAPLEALLRAGINLCAVVEPAPDELAGNEPFTRLEPSRWAASGAARRGLPMAGVGGGALATTRSIREVAASVGAPTYSVRRLRDAGFLAEMAAYRPDAICAACFTKKLPPELLAIPRLGALNAHPSLLPKGRGPDPLFWFFHSALNSYNEVETGVTIHLMDNFLDTGPILLQNPVKFTYFNIDDDRIHDAVLQKTIGFNQYKETSLASEAQLEAFLGALAGDMFVEALARLVDDRGSPKPQDDTEAIYENWPQVEDYTIDTRDPSWGYMRAYIFAHGVAGRNQPIIITAQDGARFQTIPGTEPLGYQSNYHIDSLFKVYKSNQFWQMEGDRVDIRVAGGVFSCLATRLD